MISSILGFLIVITILVFFHELGHYLAARICGVKVTDFSIGFGKSLFSFKDRNGTIWRFCAIPFGGYVKMFGDLGPASNSDNSKLSKLNDDEKKISFAYQPLKNKFFIVSAGPLANFILAIVILLYFNFSYGKYTIDPIVGEVMTNSPAYESRIKSGDKILSINNKKIDSFYDISRYVSIRPAQSLSITLERGEEKLDVNLVSAKQELKDKNGKILTTIGIIGIRPKDEPRKIELGILESIFASIQDCITITQATLTGLYQMLVGDRSISELRGTLTIADQSGKSFDKGYAEMLLFIALLSVNLGIVNLLPIPVLDGGHLMFYIYEAITGSKPAAKAEELSYKIGFVIIIIIFVISITNDIKAIIL